MSSDAMKVSNSKIRETAAKFHAASQNLPENFINVVKTFKQYAESSGSNAVRMRAEECEEILKKKLQPTSELLEEISRCMNEAADKNEEADS